MNFRGHGRIQAQLSVSLDHPAEMASGVIGQILSRFIAGDVPESKMEMYLQWMSLLNEAFDTGGLAIAPDGKNAQLKIQRYYHGIMAELDWESDWMTKSRAEVRQIAEELCNGQKTIIKC